MSRDGQLRVHWVKSEREVPDALWQACFPPPLEGRWWYAVLEQAKLEEQFEFLYGIIERNGSPVGLAPVFLMEVPIDLVAPDWIAWLLVRGGALWPRLRYQRTLFVGSPCADEGTVGLLPGVTLGDVAVVLQDALEEIARQSRAAMIVWKDFPRETWLALENMAEMRGLFPVASYPGTRMKFSRISFDDYLKQLNSEKRRKIKIKLRHSHERGGLEALHIQRPTEALLQEIFGLYWQTYQKAETRFERLTPEFFQNIATSSAAFFHLLRDPQTGRLAAFELSFLIGPRYINKFIGFDYNHYGGDWFIYFRLVEASLDWAARHGASEVQCGQTGYRPKFDLGYRPVALNNYCRHRSRLIHQLFAAVARHITWSTLDEDLAVYVKAHGERSY